MNLDFRVIASIFVVVFIAEMGDKTQLTAFTLASSSRKPWVVFGASALAFLCSSVISGVLGGVFHGAASAISSWVGPALFIVFGALVLIRGDPPAISEAFSIAAKSEGDQAAVMIPELRKRGLMTAPVEESLRDEKFHQVFFQLLLRLKRLFKDDINENTAELLRLSESMRVPKGIGKLSDDELLDESIRLESAFYAFYTFLLTHLTEHDDHERDPMIPSLRTAVADELRHKEMYEAIKRDRATL